MAVKTTAIDFYPLIYDTYTRYEYFEQIYFFQNDFITGVFPLVFYSNLDKK